MARRKRKRRHVLLSLVPEKAWPRIVQGLVATALAVLPASAVKWDATDKQERSRSAANENTSALVDALAAVAWERDSLSVEATLWRRRYYKLAGTMPTGPEVPAGWVTQPVKRKKLFGIF